jgi:hypothetical protein
MGFECSGQKENSGRKQEDLSVPKHVMNYLHATSVKSLENCGITYPACTIFA